MNNIEKLQQQIKDSKRIVFFGGAGVSTESGIPDFRSAEGIFVQETGYQYSPEEIISHSFFQQHPKERMRDRKSTRLNSSHVSISYAVFCLKKKISNNS